MKIGCFCVKNICNQLIVEIQLDVVFTHTYFYWIGMVVFPAARESRQRNVLNIDLFEVEMAAVQNNGGYVVEMKVKIPYYRKSEGTVALNVQLNNTYAADSDASNWDTRNGGCYGTQPAKHDPIVVALSDKSSV